MERTKLVEAANEALAFLLTINASYPETDALIARLKDAVRDADPKEPR